MAIKFDFTEYHISAVFMDALTNEDTSELTEEQAAQLDNFLDTTRRDCVRWEVLPDSGHWHKCEVSGLETSCFYFHEINQTY